MIKEYIKCDKFSKDLENNGVTLDNVKCIKDGLKIEITDDEFVMVKRSETFREEYLAVLKKRMREMRDKLGDCYEVDNLGSLLQCDVSNVTNALSTLTALDGDSVSALSARLGAIVGDDKIYLGFPTFEYANHVVRSIEATLEPTVNVDTEYDEVPDNGFTNEDAIFLLGRVLELLSNLSQDTITLLEEVNKKIIDGVYEYQQLNTLNEILNPMRINVANNETRRILDIIEVLDGEQSTDRRTV